MVNKIVILSTTLLILLPTFALGLQIYKQSSNVPYMDQWELVWDFQKLDRGQYGINDLWRQHNEHRLLFPRLVMITDAYITHWNVRYEMAITFVFAILCLTILYLVLRKQNILRLSGWLFFLVMFAISVMLFSFNQAENWLWGWQLQWTLTCLGVLVAIWALSREQLKNYHYLVAIAAATVATYSLGSGQFIWVIGLFLLYAFGHKLRYWFLAATPVLISYYYSYSKVGSPLTPHDIIVRPAAPIKYFFAYIGRPLTENIYYAFFLGVLGIVVFIICLVLAYRANTGSLRNKLQIIAVPVALSSFAFLSGAATTLSRTNFGIGQALSSRYITVSTYFWIALLIAFITALYTNTKKSAFLLIGTNFLCIFLAAVIAASNKSTIFFSQDANMLKHISTCTKQLPLEDTCLKSAYPTVDKIKRDIQYLKDKQWAGYSN